MNAIGTLFRDPIDSGLTRRRLTAWMDDAESGRKERNSRVSTIFSLGVEKEQTGAGRYSRTSPARPNSQARTGTGRKCYFVFPVQLTTRRIGNDTG